MTLMVRQFVRDLRAHGLNVYMTLAFEDHISENASAARPKRWQLGFPGDPSSDHFGDASDPARGLAMADQATRITSRFVAEFWETYTHAGGALRQNRWRGRSGAVLAGGPKPRGSSARAHGRDYLGNDFRDELEAMVRPRTRRLRLAQ